MENDDEYFKTYSNKNYKIFKLAIKSKMQLN